MLKEVLDAMDIPRYELAGYEADDLIGTISRKCEAAGWACVVVTGDKDSLQLITDKTKVKLVSTRMGQTTTKDMTEEAFREAYGFDPIHIIDLKALMGDASDNIPGVSGVGEKTAMALMQRYQTVEAIYEAMPEIEARPAVIKKLAEGEDSARMSYRLATIVTDAPLDFDPEANLRRAPSRSCGTCFCSWSSPSSWRSWACTGGPAAGGGGGRGGDLRERDRDGLGPGGGTAGTLAPGGTTWPAWLCRICGACAWSGASEGGGRAAVFLPSSIGELQRLPPGLLCPGDPKGVPRGEGPDPGPPRGGAAGGGHRL